MLHYNNITIIGTSHIARNSVAEITREFNNINPKIVCVELDSKRMHALLTNLKPDYSLRGIRQYGLQGYLFAVIGSIMQRKLGNVVGIQPGSDMLCAVNLARNNEKRLELIDQDISITLRRLSKEFSFKEKMRLIADFIKAPFSKRQRIDLHSVPESRVIETLMAQLRQRYPNLYRVLVEERNIFMAKRIYSIEKAHPYSKVLVVVGAGHEKELLQLIKKEEFKRDKIR